MKEYNVVNNHYKILLVIALGGSPLLANHEPILLKSEILLTVDGKTIGINGDTVSLMKKYQADIMHIIRGKRNATGAREGLFEFRGIKYSVAEIQEFEDQGLLSHEDQKSLLKKMRDYFEAISLEFKPAAHGSKPIMSLLIIESCHLRNRNDSLLVAWSKTKDHDEAALFDKYVKSIKDFEMFLIDLYNFLSDMCNSCPKAMHQFEERKERFAKIKSLMSTLTISKDKETAFIKFATKMAEHLNPGEITEHTMQEFYKAFNKPS